MCAPVTVCYVIFLVLQHIYYFALNIYCHEKFADTVVITYASKLFQMLLLKLYSEDTSTYN